MSKSTHKVNNTTYSFSATFTFNSNKKNSSAEGRYASRSVIVDFTRSDRHKGKFCWLTRAKQSNKHMALPVNTLTLSLNFGLDSYPSSLSVLCVSPGSAHWLTDVLVFILSCSLFLSISFSFYSIDNQRSLPSRSLLSRSRLFF